jgi:hypothetical protein
MSRLTRREIVILRSLFKRGAESWIMKVWDHASSALNAAGLSPWRNSRLTAGGQLVGQRCASPVVRHLTSNGERGCLRKSGRTSDEAGSGQTKDLLARGGGRLMPNDIGPMIARGARPIPRRRALSKPRASLESAVTAGDIPGLKSKVCTKSRSSNAPNAWPQSAPCITSIISCRLPWAAPTTSKISNCFAPPAISLSARSILSLGRGKRDACFNQNGLRLGAVSVFSGAEKVR